MNSISIKIWKEKDVTILLIPFSVTGLFISCSSSNIFHDCVKTFYQCSDMIYGQNSALISGQRAKEDTNHSEHLTQKRRSRNSASLTAQILGFKADFNNIAYSRKVRFTHHITGGKSFNFILYLLCVYALTFWGLEIKCILLWNIFQCHINLIYFTMMIISVISITLKKTLICGN